MIRELRRKGPGRFIHSRVCWFPMIRTVCAISKKCVSSPRLWKQLLLFSYRNFKIFPFTFNVWSVANCFFCMMWCGIDCVFVVCLFVQFFKNMISLTVHFSFHCTDNFVENQLIIYVQVYFCNLFCFINMWFFFNPYVKTAFPWLLQYILLFREYNFSRFVLGIPIYYILLRLNIVLLHMKHKTKQNKII